MTSVAPAGAAEVGRAARPLSALVESASEPGKLHRVTLAWEDAGFVDEEVLAWRCDCVGFRFGLRRHLRPECRHVRAVKGAVEDGVRALAPSATGRDGWPR